MPRFSIITVCLNEEVSIRSTCESICRQTFADFEWIVVDGGSSDQTLRILSEYDDSIAFLLSEPDGGIYDAMNKGVRLATGDYLLFLNAGDYLYDDDVLENISRMPNKDIVYGDLQYLDAAGGRFVNRYPDVLSKYYLLHKMMPHQATFISRALFQKFGIFDLSYKIAADYDLFVRFIYLHNASCTHYADIVAVFRTDGISSKSKYRTLRKIENHLIRKDYFPWLRYGLKGLRMEFRLLFNREYR